MSLEDAVAEMQWWERRDEEARELQRLEAARVSKLAHFLVTVRLVGTLEEGYAVSELFYRGEPAPTPEPAP